LKKRKLQFLFRDSQAGAAGWRSGPHAISFKCP